MSEAIGAKDLSRGRLVTTHRLDCPICGSLRIEYLFISQGTPICQCVDCHLMFRNPQPSDDALSQIYSAGYFLGDTSPEGQASVSSMKRRTARLYLDRLLAYAGDGRGSLLEVGCGTGELLADAAARGFEVAGLELSPHAAAKANARLGRDAVRCGAFDEIEFPPHRYDVCVLSDVIEHLRDPLGALRKVHALLKPDGVVFLATPSVESWSAKLLRRRWMEFKPEHLTFFSPATVENALAKAGFDRVGIESNYKMLTPEYIHLHFQRFRVPVISGVTALGYRLLPGAIRRRQMKVVASGIVVMARASRRTPRRTLSIIVPVFNERRTVATVLDAVLEKSLAGLDKEVIVVESNSTDGTREAVLRYAGAPGVRLVLEPAPRGKGHAVRTGLTHATGELVLIQDADLEYDLNDYDALLDPLVHYRAAFVLGSRHGGGWKMRRFSDNPAQAIVMNLGHVFFTTLLNVLYRQRMKDPFTMFKVFRRDCVHDLRFECNGFDFDHELVIKLVRKGYTPLEIPVNYRSRSFREGKKVRFFRDPLRWLWVDLKLRFVGIRTP